MNKRAIAAVMLGLLCGNVLAQSSPPAAAPAAAPPRVTRPALLFREEWKQTAKGGEHPVGAESVGNDDLELNLHVPAGEILLTGAAGDENNPIHLWTGMCTTPCAATLRSKTRLANLTGLARIRWNTKMSGFHQVRPLVKLADGTWLVGDQAAGGTRDWLVSEIAFADVRWLKLDIARVVTTGTLLDKVDLTQVDEIGFADLTPGSGHGPGGWSDVAQIEAYAGPVARQAKQ
ncbi:MAG TPA: hypothetical protein VEQ17_04325 [Steroidobacteraceae bacterium]|nr:hypothetical protein [Steroidobacteraceae bacterium]